MQTPYATQHIEVAKAKAKKSLSRAYANMEVYNKLYHVITKHSMSVNAASSSFMLFYYPDTNDPRGLSHIAWQIFEELDELLDMEKISLQHNEDIQHYNIYGSYANIRLNLCIFYSGLKTCKIVYIDETIKVAKTICS